MAPLSKQKKHSTEEDLQEPLLESPRGSPENPESESKSKSKKRKRAGQADSNPEKTAKKAKNKKSKAEDDDDLDLEAGINNAFSSMPSQLLADYVAQRTRKFESDLSSVELEDKYIPGMMRTPFC